MSDPNNIHPCMIKLIKEEHLDETKSDNGGYINLVQIEPFEQKVKHKSYTCHYLIECFINDIDFHDGAFSLTYEMALENYDRIKANALSVKAIHSKYVKEG